MKSYYSSYGCRRTRLTYSEKTDMLKNDVSMEYILRGDHKTNESDSNDRPITGIQEEANVVPVKWIKWERGITNTFDVISASKTDAVAAYCDRGWMHRKTINIDDRQCISQITSILPIQSSVALSISELPPLPESESVAPTCDPLCILQKGSPINYYGVALDNSKKNKTHSSTGTQTDEYEVRLSASNKLNEDQLNLALYIAKRNKRICTNNNRPCRSRGLPGSQAGVYRESDDSVFPAGFSPENQINSSESLQDLSNYSKLGSPIVQQECHVSLHHSVEANNKAATAEHSEISQLNQNTSNEIQEGSSDRQRPEDVSLSPEICVKKNRRKSVNVFVYLPLKCFRSDAVTIVSLPERLNKKM